MRRWMGAAKRWMLAMVLGLILTLAGEAQSGLFGTLSAVFAPSGTGYSSTGTAGLTLGLYSMPVHGGPVALGFEVRGLAAPSIYELVAGGRVALRGKRFRPYGTVLAGVEGQRTGFRSSGSAFGYQAGGGLDISQGRWVDWRAVDVTAGALFTVATGVAVRF